MGKNDAVAEVIASFMRYDTLSKYRFERDNNINPFDPRYTGHHVGCLSEAGEFQNRLLTRGYVVISTDEYKELLGIKSDYENSHYEASFHD